MKRLNHALVLTLSLLLSATLSCTDPSTAAGTDAAASGDAAAAPSGPPSGAEGDDARTGESAAERAAALYACVDDDFGELKPLGGAGLDPASGLVGERQGRYIVHTTQLVVPPEGMEAFTKDMQGIFAAMSQVEGLVALSLGNSKKCGFQRTLGVWRDEGAMWAFVGSSAHAVAMTHTTDYATAGRVAYWEATADEVEALTWATARAHAEAAENSPVFGD